MTDRKPKPSSTKAAPDAAGKKPPLTNKQKLAVHEAAFARMRHTFKVAAPELFMSEDFSEILDKLAAAKTGADWNRAVGHLINWAMSRALGARNHENPAVRLAIGQLSGLVAQGHVPRRGRPFPTIFDEYDGMVLQNEVCRLLEVAEEEGRAIDAGEPILTISVAMGALWANDHAITPQEALDSKNPPKSMPADAMRKRVLRVARKAGIPLKRRAPFGHDAP